MKLGSSSHTSDASHAISQGFEKAQLGLNQTLRDDVSLIGTPDYGVAGCPPGYYRSYVIARQDDPRTSLSAFTTAPFAYNDPMSQSGWAALALEAPEVLHGPRLCTGGHRLSALAVRKGDADFATIDAVTWRHLDAAGETAGLKIIHSTAPTPGLPYISAKLGPVHALFAATEHAIAMLDPQDRAALHLKALIALPPSAYALPLPSPVEAIDR